MNRHAHIVRTLPENLERNKKFAADIEFVLVNFIIGREGEETDEWIRNNFKSEIDSGYLKYFISDKMRNFHASIAKNTSHINASGLYLFNLDADNYITPKEVDFLLKECVFGSVVHGWSEVYHDGSYGRIGVGAYEFLKLNGYNESLEAFSFQDIDLLKRCSIQLKKRIKRMTPEKQAIQNSALEKLANTKWAKQCSSEKDAQKVRNMLNAKNIKHTASCTKNYLLLFKQEKMGVDAIKVTIDDSDPQRANRTIITKLLIRLRSFTIKKTVSFLYLSLSRRMLRSKIILYSVYRYLFLANTKRKKISFCISVMNRHAYIVRTLPENLEKNKKFAADIEFVLVNFIIGREGEETDEWIRNNFKSEIDSGYLKYFVSDKMRSFHMSTAKNTSHINASGLYLFNLDADNYITPKEVDFLLKECIFGSLVHGWSGVHDDGSHGRIGLGAYEFLKLNGYNERLEAIGYEDTNLRNRCSIQLKKRVKRMTPEKQAIQNSALEKLANTKWAKQCSSEKDAQKVRSMLIAKNIKYVASCTENYSLLFKQKKIGVDAVKVTIDDSDSQRANRTVIMKLLIFLRSMVIKSVSFLYLSLLQKMLRSKIILYSVYRYLFLANTKRKKISFCISVMNRHAHIVRTLPENLERNKKFAADIEFVLVNFIIGREGEETDEWIRNNFKSEINSGYLKYFVSDKMRNFHASIAKNTSHINASGLYLFNLDADNYITPKEVDFLLKECVFGSVVHGWSEVYHDGSYGRIGVGAYEFLKLNGYNESLEAFSFQDIDLLKRCSIQLKKRIKRMTPEKQAIQNSALEKLANTKWAKQCSSEKDAQKVRNMLNAKNIKHTASCTKNYLLLFKQEKMGVDAIKVTIDDSNSQRANRTIITKLLIFLRSMVIKSVSFLYLSLLQKMLRSKIILYSVYRALFLAHTKRKKISFCITVMNRHAHIVRTLSENLEKNKKFAADIEFVLVNFIIGREGEETDEWIRNNFKSEIDSGYLKYFVSDKMRSFHMSTAKNTSHINASGLYLFNLDADNYITPKEVDFLLKECIFGSVVHGWSGVHDDGSHGRIGVGVYEFLKLNGYNEHLEAIGYEDADILNRCRIQLRKKIKRLAPEKRAIQNSVPERIANTKWAKQCSSEKDAQKVIAMLDKKNLKYAYSCTKSYLLLFKQGTMGVDAVKVNQPISACNEQT